GPRRRYRSQAPLPPLLHRSLPRYVPQRSRLLIHVVTFRDIVTRLPGCVRGRHEARDRTPAEPTGPLQEPPPVRLERDCFLCCLRWILGCSVGSGWGSAAFLRPSIPLADPPFSLALDSSPGCGWLR